MASGLVVHIVAGNDRRTDVLSHERIRVGAGPGYELQLPPGLLPYSADPSVPVLELSRVPGDRFRITGFDHAVKILHNGQPVKEQAAIMDSDEISFGDSNLRMQFFPLNGLPALVSNRLQEMHVAPFIEQAALDASVTARRDDAKIFLREFIRELVREINPSTKLIVLAISLALVGGILYLGFGFYQEMQRNRRLVEEQQAQLTQMRNEVDKNNSQLGNIDRSNHEIRDILSLAPKLRSEYGAGVCLIAGTFYFVESGTNRPLRYPEAQTGEEEATAPTNANTGTTLTPEGKGPVAEFEVVGTGFYVGNGYVMTNRHVAQPWLADSRVQGLSSSVNGQPRLKRLIAFFPDDPQPFVLRLKQSAPREDLAVCTLDTKDVPRGIPALPLDKDNEAVAVGKEVVLMGYPSGQDRLLARLDESEARSIQARCGASIETLLNCLAEKKYIQPLTTRGHITDLNARRVVYDANTSEGGSGAPLFGPSGRVIGINFAVFTENSASNFAVPVRYGIALLQRAGWQPPSPTETEQAENGAPPGARPNAGGPPSNTLANTSH